MLQSTTRSSMIPIAFWFYLVASYHPFQCTEAAAIFKGTAAIFGVGGGRSKENENGGQTIEKQISPPPLPPTSNKDPSSLRPPPPPPPKDTLHQARLATGLDSNKTSTPDNGALEEQNPLPPLSNLPPQPPPTYFSSHGPPPAEPWMMGPPPVEEWQPYPSSSFQNTFDQMVPDSQFMGSLQYELDLTLQREHELQEQLNNATMEVSAMKQREELHIRQLDVLTERVMDTEAASASERNQLLQYQANCTEMSEEIRVLEGCVEDWKNRSEEYLARVKKGEEEVAELKKKTRALARKAEDLAALIERHRLASEPSKSSSTPSGKTKKSRGFFAWLFGWDSDDEYDTDDELEEAHKTGRSTLLEALQRERDNVEELETAVVALQQNNTAVAEQVHSRDLIISELNDRVAVFEEDKVVLKAALKQLQIEMKEEVPKSTKLAEDLQSAREEIARLNAEIESLVVVHQEEMAFLQSAINEKTEAIHETESNLTVIGGYVDKLEERLADFAIARRDISKREELCLKSEKLAEDARQENDKLRHRIGELDKEHAELKQLFQELVNMRTKLQNDCNQLTKERDVNKRKNDKLQQAVDSLKAQLQSLEQDDKYWMERSNYLERELNATLANNALVENDLRQNASYIEGLRQQLDGSTEARYQLEEVVRSMNDSRMELEQKLSVLEESQSKLYKNEQTTRKTLEQRDFELEKARESIEQLKNDYDSKLEQIMNEARHRNEALEKSEIRVQDLKEKLHQAETRESRFRQGGREEAAGEKSKSTASPINLSTSRGPVVPASEIAAVQEALKGSGTVGNVSNRTAPPLPSSSLRMPQANISTKPAVPSKGVQKARQEKQRKVPLRKCRKFFSRITGIHGLFTPSSKTRKAPMKRPSFSQQSMKVSAPPSNKKGQVPPRSGETPSQQGKPGASLGIPRIPNGTKTTSAGIRYPEGQSSIQP